MEIKEAITELAEQMETATNAILVDAYRRADTIVTDTLEQLDLRAVRDSQIPLVQMIKAA